MKTVPFLPVAFALSAGGGLVPERSRLPRKIGRRERQARDLRRAERKRQKRARKGKRR